jgi:hypothetical protein
MIRDAEKLAKSDPYARHASRARDRFAAISLSGRDISPIPAITDQARRDACARNFRLFCETYLPRVFSLAWSPDHLKIISKIETAVLEGGLFAHAMPRGSGKTTLCEAACLWATLYGHRRFVVIIGSEEAGALERLDSIKAEIECNTPLYEDFPEACHPVRKIEGIAQRGIGQVCDGQRTYISVSAKELVLATIPNSACSGAVVRAVGLTGRIRGMMYKRPDGRSVRPDLVILDDPQTDESAHSVSQCHTRETLLAGAVLGMAGPGRKIAAIMPCTVIRKGDMADRILDRSIHPMWQGERMKLLYSLPTNTQLWDQYAAIRADSYRFGGRGEEATEFYKKNRAAMDEGAEVAWPQRFEPGEISAVQFAMNIKLRDEHAFWAEYQNDPHTDGALTGKMPTPEEITAKICGTDRRTVPLSASRVVAFVDVQQTLLYYVVCAFADDFTGWLIDYGGFPDQGSEYFILRDAHPTLAMISPKAGVEGAVYGGLKTLTESLLRHAWKREDGAELKIERCLIDQGWLADTVNDFIRGSTHGGVLIPSKGFGVTASNKPMNEYHRKPGDRVGMNWRVAAAPGKRALRSVLFDSNWWKTFLFNRMATAMGDRGSMSFYGKRPSRHRMLADHLLAEYYVPTEGRGRKVNEWKLRPDKPDNHLLDCMTGCMVAASMQGVKLTEAGSDSAVRRKPRKKMTLSELQRAKRGY